MVAVKICGLTDEAAFDMAVECGARWVGFVFFDRSPRHITPVQAARLSSRTGSGPLRVGLFVNPSDDEIRGALDHVALDILQIYASPERTAEIRGHFALPLWRACAVQTRGDLPAEALADALVIESRAPENSTRPGGNGVSFDWSITRDWQAPAPWLLAGGLTPDNVGLALRTSGAPAVDVSSGVESERGVKSPEMIRDFINSARDVLGS